MCVQLSSILLILLLSLFVSRLPRRLGPLYHSVCYGQVASFLRQNDHVTVTIYSSGSSIVCVQLSTILLILLLSLFVSRLPRRLGPLYHSVCYGQVASFLRQNDHVLLEIIFTQLVLL